MTLARGLVWCKSCQVRTALSDAGGKCPVCDPDQGNRVSKHAADELDRIDAVLAGSDTRWEGAEWRADGSHQDGVAYTTNSLENELREYDWRDAYAHRHVIPQHPFSPQNLGRGGSGFGRVRLTTFDGPVIGYAEWPPEDSDDELELSIDLGALWRIPERTLTVQIIPVSHSFSDALLSILFGPDWYYSEREALDRWEDDGGPIMAAGDL